MSKKNDEKILQLKTIVEQKKSELQKIGRFYPITTCILEIDGIQYNLHALDESQASYLLVKLSVLKEMETKLQEQGDSIVNIMFRGFTLEDWIQDVRGKLNDIAYQRKKYDLISAEKRLEELLSEDKKTELELKNLSEVLESI